MSKKTDKNSKRYEGIPKEFWELAAASGMDSPGGDGYYRRIAVARLFGIPAENIRTWIRSAGKDARATSFNIARIKALLWVLGYRPEPVTHVESFEIDVGLGATKPEEINKILGYSQLGQNMFPRLMDGAPITLRRREIMATYVAKNQDRVGETRAEWLKTLLAAGFVAKGKPPTAPPPDSGPAAPAAAPEVANVPDVDVCVPDATPASALVDITAAHVKALLPLVEHIGSRGTPEDRDRLRRLLPDGPGNKVFRLQVALAPLCSETAARKNKK